MPVWTMRNKSGKLSGSQPSVAVLKFDVDKLDSSSSSAITLSKSSKPS